MFHEGDLQSGIATAIQQQKLVTCFVYDDSAGSNTWERDLLPSLQDLITKKTVLLKIKLKSQEASFLSAFCPMDVAPSLAVIDNGKVIVKLQTPIDAEDWRSQVKKALHSQDTVHPVAAQSAPVAAPTPVEPVPDRPATSSGPNGAAASSATTLQSLLPDRAARLEADQATKQAEEKAARIARAEARRREIESTSTTASAKGKEPASSDPLPPKARTDWVREQAKRKEEAKQERERILKQIQSDREERKLRDAIAKETMAAPQPMQIPARSTSIASATCALQLRLDDGSSIRKQFSADQTLRKDVRSWIKDTAPPETVQGLYTFRHLLAPRPSKDIDVAEEEQSLASLGLTPSATLVLLPALSQASTAPSGLLKRLFSTLLGILASFFSVFTGARGSVGAPTEAAEDLSQQSSTRMKATGVDNMSSSARLRTKTLADSRAAEDNDAPTEFYNGNSSAFESRKDDDAD